MSKSKTLALITCITLASGMSYGATLDDLLNSYKQAGATTFDVRWAQDNWVTKHKDTKSGEDRSCSTCHSNNLKNPGKHATTGKVIEPIAPTVTKDRLTDPAKIEKWFKRNCTWVLGRECTPTEKGSYLLFISQH